MDVQYGVLSENDALPLEHKLMNRSAPRDIDGSNSVNDPVGLGVVWISGHGLEEELFDFLGLQGGALRYNVADPLLVSLD